MTIESAIYSRLSGDAAVAALAGTRIYPVQAPPAAARPYVVYLLVAAARDRTFAGPSGLVDPRYQFDCYADDADTAAALARAVRAALDGWRGRVGLDRVEGGNVFNEFEAFEPDTRLHRRTLEAYLPTRE